MIESNLFPEKIAWCPYVTKAPLDNKIIVLNNGNEKVSNGIIPTGGHVDPNSTAGDKALWKKAQKIAKKNKASETMNKPTPIFKPRCTERV